MSVCDLLFRQIVKNKSKLEHRLKSSAFNAEYDDAPYQPEAILQMNMLGHDFFVYRNAANGEINVVYKRKGGAYGVIEAVEEEE